jgi:hypothetical protein
MGGDYCMGLLQGNQAKGQTESRRSRVGATRHRKATFLDKSSGVVLSPETFNLNQTAKACKNTRKATFLDKSGGVVLSPEDIVAQLSVVVCGNRARSYRSK